MTLSSSAPRFALFACVFLAVFSTSACVHRLVIQQGNFLKTEDIDRVESGMTRVQVRALLGTPMVADPFNVSRWDYVYYLESQRLKNPIRRHFIVFFDDEDKVDRVERLGAPPDVDTSSVALSEDAE